MIRAGSVVAPAMSTAPGAPITVAASPFTYQNTSGWSQMVIVSGGTVSTISYSRDGTNYFLVGLLAGQHALGVNEYLRIVYVSAPTMTAFNTSPF